jgi:hypothetical protein
MEIKMHQIRFFTFIVSFLLLTGCPGNDRQQKTPNGENDQIIGPDEGKKNDLTKPDDLKKSIAILKAPQGQKISTPTLPGCQVYKFKIEEVGALKNICKIKYIPESKPCIELLSKNKQWLVPINEKYVQLWNQHFDTLIKNTSITFYQGKKPNKNTVLISPINLGSKNIHYKLQGIPFKYEPHKAYANFANQYWGGGVLGGANVQEEIKMRQSNALPWIAQKTSASSNKVSWCPNIAINDLDNNPVVMSLSLFLNFDNKKGYGRKMHVMKKTQQKELLTPFKTKPIEIYSFAMAAPYMKKSNEYQKKLLEDMFYTAHQAFLYTMLAMDHDNRDIEIHTGNWGAGAFNHSIKMSWALQWLAINSAFDAFSKESSPKTIKYFHDAYGSTEADIIKAASQEFNNLVGQGKKSISSIIEKLLTKAKTDKSWQIGASSTGET